jgi:DNA-binding response OmpR family regulator
VLLVDDEPSFTEILAHWLEHHGYAPRIQRVWDRPSMQSLLIQHPWDLIIADHRMPRFDSFQALRTLKECKKEIPFFCLSSYLSNAEKTRLLREGAEDILSKEEADLEELGLRIEKGLSHCRMRQMFQLREEEMRTNQAQFLQSIKHLEDELKPLLITRGLIDG